MKKNKLIAFGILLAVLAVAIIVLAAASSGTTFLSGIIGTVATPVEHGFSAIGDGVSHFFGYFRGYDELLEENERLRAKIVEYQQFESEYYSAVRENEELRALAELKQQYTGFDLEMCSVVSAVTRDFTSSFSINAGTADGIEPGDCVMCDRGFIGYIGSAGYKSAEVITLLNVESKLAADITRTREVVVAEGNFKLASSGMLKIPYLKNDDDIEIGDIVETSSVGEKYPSGLIIGTVSEIKQEEHGISKYAIVTPSVDLSDLHTVYVVRDFKIVE